MPDEAVRIFNYLGTIFILLSIISFVIAFVLNIVKKQVDLNDFLKKFQIVCAILTPAFLIISIVLYVFANVF
ncbi:hypothetical protein ACWEX2_13575 [Staphylococcus xylosus]|uniref:Uncharacterized protein n=1 Tax=Staphylococcus xylosus TaxID=1288 RepID=A0AAQ0LXP2_STAXY|nr:hypothetical protein [Staphylococcus xylosus]RIM64089.1 hypothetical protein BU122_12155 [Staphylococcus xylosus]RIM90656.1 hypothetical protein BU104_13615 [Staphylococcus xylosus]